MKKLRIAKIIAASEINENLDVPYGISVDFVKSHDIDPDEIGYLGSGDNGEAYVVGDDRALKITRSRKEFEHARRLINHNYTNIVDIYAVEKIGSDYYILMEELSPIDESEFHEAEPYMPDGAYYFESYIESEEETEDTELEPPDSSVVSFLGSLRDVVYDLRSAGFGSSVDIQSGNLGWSGGTLKAFDLMEKG